MAARAAAMVAGVVLASACVAVTTLDGERLRLGSPAFRAYVESVFREQNRVATELLFALEAVGPAVPDHARLEAAELELVRACRGLNEIAAERRAGRELGTLREAGAARQAPQCERAARAAAEALAASGQQAPDRD